MELKKYLSFDGLTKYDSLIKTRTDEKLSDKQNKDLIVEFADSDNTTVTKSVAEIATAVESGAHVKLFDGGEYLDLLGCSTVDNFALFYAAYCIGGEWNIKTCAIVGTSVMENTTEKYNYATKEDIPQSDWSQNDETALDYVKNRTHWVEPNMEVLVPEQEISGGGSLSDCESSILGYNTTITVTFDGVAYQCEIWNNTFGELCLGDSRLTTIFNDNGEEVTDETHPDDVPFYINYYEDNSGFGGDGWGNIICNWYYACRDEETHTIKVEVEGDSVYHTLDEKYIPDTIARKSDVPAKVTVDTSLSTTSSNPVRNSVVTSNINSLKNLVGTKSVSTQISEAIAEIPEPVQVDWNQNDETATDYVKNRTHWEDNNITFSTIFENISVDVREENDFGALGYTDKTPVVGSIYNIAYATGGYLSIGEFTNYECIAYMKDEDDSIYIGKITDECPFYIKVSQENGQYKWEANDNQAFGWSGIKTFTLTVEGYTGTCVYHPLDEKFIPETIASKDYVKSLVNSLNVLIKTQQTLTDEELTQVRKNLKFIGKDVEGQTFNINGQDIVASVNAEIFGDYENNKCTGQWSIVEGSTNIATGRACHVEGAQNQALNDGCHVEGVGCIASGFWSHAEGEMTRVTSYASHAEGSYTKMPDGTTRYGTASGYASHVEGGGCHAQASCSHSEGLATTTKGNYSHSEGRYTIASSPAQHVEGVANIEDSTSTYIHIAGNGDWDARSNAHTLDWEGNAWFSGDVYVGSTSGINKDEGSKKLLVEDDMLITVEDIDAICGATIDSGAF